MKIESKRLIIKPLTTNQVSKYLKNDNSLEKELGLNYSLRVITKSILIRLKTRKIICFILYGQSF